MSLPKLIDNDKVTLADTLRKISKDHKKLSIATGYWDLSGTSEIINEIEHYQSIRLLIGKEPLSHRKQAELNLLDSESDDLFPEKNFMHDLTKLSDHSELYELRNSANLISKLISQNRMQVKIIRDPRLHAKAYIFGDKNDNNAIGIVGSSNFTKAGLTSNTELNSLESDFRIVTFQPTKNDHENGHLSWFEKLWNHENAIEWSGEFSRIIETSPVGNQTFGPYEVYIKTLMEIYADEIIPPKELDKDTFDVLYSFQNRNAGILINKLDKMGLAILSDSVGLGKTITAGAVIKHYLGKQDGKSNIQIIAPAALKKQWIEDLSSLLDIDYRDGAFNIVSQQDIKAIREIKEYYDKEWRKTKNIDLFVIDEAHNLRSSSGSRHDAILELLQQHQNSHILLLTATPINNSLMDITNQIQLASKGKRNSINVPYIRPSSKDIEMLDFFEALKRIQNLIKRSEKNGDDVEEVLNVVKPTIHAGLRHYLVRSTRQGVEAEGGIIDSNGNNKVFPKSIVESIDYKYSDAITSVVNGSIGLQIETAFEGIDPRNLNLLLMSEFTQQSLHPLDFVNNIKSKKDFEYELFNLKENITDELGKLFLYENVKSIVPNILQCVFLLGFTPYKPEVYKQKYYCKTVEEIRNLKDVPENLRIQLSIHNILQITWLKRMESSGSALLNSINNYLSRIQLFEKYLNMGFIVSLNEASLLESDYNDGEDLEQAFEDYEAYLSEKDKLISEGKDESELKKYGVEKKPADSKVYMIDQMKKDILRDKRILYFLKEILKDISSPEHDIKMNKLADHLLSVISSGKYGKKILVFSFFADTIKHLEENLNKVISSHLPDFELKSEYIYGNGKNKEEIVRRFSPKSKKYALNQDDIEINYLFSTDILSEGQNLQDAGYLINYDLHWNPVRMIQRNGRINRLGSDFSQVLIANMKPTDELEVYLRLVNRLERKIKTIRNTVGLDQGVLTSKDVNPIEFIEKYYIDGVLPEPDDELLADNDEHIIELRTFLAKNKNNSEYINGVQNIPKGKWNYLPSKSHYPNRSIALAEATGMTKESEKKISELFFIDIECFGEHKASYIEYNQALDLIKTTSDDNRKVLDQIKYDRLKVISRSSAEAKRQASNPEYLFKIKPSFERALLVLNDYFDSRVDLKRTIEYGVTTIDLESTLNATLRQVNKELKKDGTIYPGTIKKFEEIFKKIQLNTSEEKIMTDAKGILYYAGK